MSDIIFSSYIHFLYPWLLCLFVGLPRLVLLSDPLYKVIDLGDSEEEDCYDSTHSQSVLLGMKEEVGEEDEMTGEMMEQAKINTEQADTKFKRCPKMPEATCLTRKEEKMSLHNLNNRLAGYIDKMRQLQEENNEFNKKIKQLEEVKTSKEIEISKMDRKLQEEHEDRMQDQKQYGTRVQELQTSLASKAARIESLKKTSQKIEDENTAHLAQVSQG